MAIEVSSFGHNKRIQLTEPQSESAGAWTTSKQNGTEASPVAQKQEARDCLGQRHKARTSRPLRNCTVDAVSEPPYLHVFASIGLDPETGGSISLAG